MMLLFFSIFASVYIYPVFQGLILLPLDLLVSNSGPWHLASQILLKNNYMTDSIIQMFPWRHLTFTSLTSAIIPLWNPYSFMGMPFMAGMKPLVFYPFNILFIFGEATSWNMLLWLQLFLSLWFTYVFTRSLNVTKSAAVISAIAFAFNSLMVGVLQFGSEGHVLLWLPLLLFFVKRFVSTGKTRFGVGISLVMATAVFAGHLQYLVYIVLLTIAYALFENKIKRKSPVDVLPIVIYILLGTGLASVQLIPGIEMFAASVRGTADSYWTFAGGLLSPYHLLRLLSPDWFGNPVTGDLHSGYIETSGYFGIIPLFFAIYAANSAWRNVYVRFFTIVGLISVLLSLNGIGQLLYYTHIPIISSGFGGRIFSLALFSGAVLAGLGFTEFLKTSNTRSHLKTLLLFFVLIGECYIFGFVANTYGAPYAIILRSIRYQVLAVVAFGLICFVYFGWKRPIIKGLFIAGVCLLTYADLFRMGYRFLTFSNPKFLYPELEVTTFIRSKTTSTLGRLYALVEPEVNVALGVQLTETYNPLYPMRTAELVQALEGKKRVGQKDNKYYLEQNERMKFVLDFLGVSVIAPRHNINPAFSWWHNQAFENDVVKLYESDGTDVYQNTGAYPRFGLFYDIRDNVTDDEALQGFSERTEDFRKTLLIRDNLGATYTAGTGSAELTKNDINSLSFRVKTDTPAVFYLSDSFDPGWHVSVNGKESRVLVANYNFRGVEIPMGESEIAFWYLPKSFLYGIALSIVSLAGLVVYAVANKRKK